MLPATLEYQRDGEIAIVHLARTAKRNALDDETVRAIESLFGNLPAEVRAVVLAARGEHFSARDRPRGTLANHRDRGPANARTCGIARSTAIQFGNVSGDRRTAGRGHRRRSRNGGRRAHPGWPTKTAYYALPEAQRGIFVGGGGSVRISRIIGADRMMDLMLSGRIYSAEEGQTLGLSQYLVAAGTAEMRAIALAKQVATLPPLSIYGILHAIPRNAEADPATRLRARRLDGGHVGRRSGGARTHRRFPRRTRPENQVRRCAVTAVRQRSVHLGPHDLDVRPLSGGGFTVRSPYELQPYPRTMTDRLAQWAVERPTQVFLAERAGAEWRTLTYAAAFEATRRIAQAAARSRLQRRRRRGDSSPKTVSTTRCSRSPRSTPASRTFRCRRRTRSSPPTLRNCATSLRRSAARARLRERDGARLWPGRLPATSSHPVCPSSRRWGRFPAARRNAYSACWKRR